jgi:predicted lipid-binding transport protein (Tim44 family)
MIANLIEQITSQTGVSQSQANTAVGGVLNLLKQNVNGVDFSSLLNGLPGAEGLMSQATSAINSGTGATSGMGGMLGGLASKFLGKSSLGGALGGVAGLSSLLAATNLNAGQLGDIASRLVAYAKENVGEEVVERILNNVPAELRSLVA